MPMENLFLRIIGQLDRMFKKKELLQKENVQKEAIKKVVGQVPQKLPAMPRKGM
ncbi:hypothetical protein [Mediterraneibacter gnavus]|uniref:hypothetical protein n=1 Tax=Mediterraneibacter gnavus TaxID=33038 RepID=UPI0022DF57B8|nr:hypothetical protein [Mediterraneibacter gnavus]